MKQLKVANIAVVLNGGTPDTKRSEYYGGDISWATPKDLSDLQEKYFFHGGRNITTQGAKSLGGIPVPKDSLLLTSRAPIGLLAINKKETYTNQGFKSIVPNPSVADVEYLYYYFKVSVDHLNNLGGGTTFKEISKSSLEAMRIVLPDLPIQKSLSKVLALLDDKINLNNKINAELEAMAKQIYDYWFVQFDFPDSSGNPYKTSGGKMVWSKELQREIPKGWYVANLSSLMSASKNGDWGSEKSNDQTIKYFCIRGADIDGLNGIEEFEPQIRYIDKSHVDRQLNTDDLIIEISGGSPTQSTGRMAHISSYVLSRLDNKVICSNFCKAISLKNAKYSYVISRHWARLYDAGIFFNHEGKTSGIKNLLFDQLAKDVKIAIPHDDLINTYYDFEESIDKQKQNSLRQNEELIKLRDWLLPMLMNGQVKVLTS